MPRSFFRPLSASFLIGGLVRFCVMSSVKPPPWMTKPGNDAVKYRAVEESVVDVAQEIGDRQRRLLLEQLDGEIAQRGFEADHEAS